MKKSKHGGLESAFAGNLTLFKIGRLPEMNMGDDLHEKEPRRLFTGILLMLGGTVLSTITMPIR
jgi:hypothetical protein